MRTRTQNYTARDAPRLLEDLGLEQQVRGWTACNTTPGYQQCTVLVVQQNLSVVLSCCQLHDTKESFPHVAGEGCDGDGAAAQREVYPKVHALTWPLPEVAFPVRCLYGAGVDTDESFFYDVERFTAGEVPPAPKEKLQGDGDGTVGRASLEACSRCRPLPSSLLISCWR